MIEEYNGKNSEEDNENDNNENNENDENNDTNEFGGLAKDIRKFDDLDDHEDSDEFDLVKKDFVSRPVSRVDNLDSLKLKKFDLEFSKKKLQQNLQRFLENSKLFF